MNEKFALVTGAGSGIGKSVARELASRKINVLLVPFPGRNSKATQEAYPSNLG